MRATAPCTFFYECSTAFGLSMQNVENYIFFTFKISLLYFKPAFLICCIRSESAMMEVILNCPPCQVQPQKNGLVQFITYLAGRFAIVKRRNAELIFCLTFKMTPSAFLCRIFFLYVRNKLCCQCVGVSLIIPG